MNYWILKIKYIWKKNFFEKRNAFTPLGIEPRTFRLSVECSIIWAKEIPYNFSHRIYLRLFGYGYIMEYLLFSFRIKLTSFKTGWNFQYIWKKNCEQRNASTPLGIEPRAFRLSVECSIIWVPLSWWVIHSSNGRHNRLKWFGKISKI